MRLELTLRLAQLLSSGRPALSARRLAMQARQRAECPAPEFAATTLQMARLQAPAAWTVERELRQPASQVALALTGRRIAPRELVPLASARVRRARATPQ